MFRTVLIANRGEIAIRIMRACRELGVSTVAIYGEEERDAPHARYADAAFVVGAGEATRPVSQRCRGSWRSRSVRGPRRSTPATASWPRMPISPARSSPPG